jgi:hypothetical protein
MPYRVQAKSLIVVVPTLSEALRIFDTLADGNPTAFISDINGGMLNVDKIRLMVDELDLSPEHEALSEKNGPATCNSQGRPLPAETLGVWPKA